MKSILFAFSLGASLLLSSIVIVSPSFALAPPSGGTPGGVFGQYFSNMKTPCTGTLDVITGFNGTMVRTCTPFANMMRGFLAGSTSSAGNVVIGFNPTTGLPMYGPGSPWVTSGTSLSYNNGNVGIGTSSPVVKLEVTGNIKIGNSGVPCNAANEGQLRYDGLAKQMQFCNGTAWGSMVGGAGGLAGGSFGGMYLQGTTGQNNFTNPYTNQYNCPTGYTARPAVRVPSGVMILMDTVYYCYKPGTIGSLGTVGAGQSCPNGNYVSGFDNNGIVQCKTLPASGGGGGGGGGGSTLGCTSGYMSMGGYVCLTWSDKNLKTNIFPIPHAIESLTRLTGVTWSWKNPEKYGTTAPMGIIAQDVETVYPDLVREVDGVKTVQYHALIGPLIEAVKELDTKNKEQDKKIQDLEKRLERLEK